MLSNKRLHDHSCQDIQIHDYAILPFSREVSAVSDAYNHQGNKALGCKPLLEFYWQQEAVRMESEIIHELIIII